MTASLPLSASELDRLFERAAAAESAGAYADSLHALTIALDDLAARDEYYQYLYEWRARLHNSLGDHERAERSLQVASGLAERAGHRPGVFRMTIARAGNAIAALELPHAEELLATLQADGPALGAAVSERCDAILEWLGALGFAEHPERNLAVLRCEVALTLAGLWAERGKYRSALRLIGAIDGELDEAAQSIRVDQVRLLEIELLLEAGDLDEAERRLQALPDDDRELEIDRARLALVRTRVALASGRLRGARESFALLDQAPPGDPQLYASAAAARIASLVELNLWREAEVHADRALRILGDSPLRRPLVELLERARASAVSHGQSILAVWELPLRKRRLPRIKYAADAPPPAAAELPADPPAAQAPPDEPPFPPAPIPAELSDAAPGRLRDRWTACANQIMQALEAEDLDRAAELHAQLTILTSGVESDLVKQRVKLLAALIAYYRDPSADLVDELMAIAGELHRMGARGAEAQATRFAAWACAKLGRAEDYSALAQRASRVIEEIADELPPQERALYLLNKWSGRDELVAGRMAELLKRHGGPRNIPRAAVCRAFQEIEVLTRWPIDHAFDDHQASDILNAPLDRTAAWVRDRLAAPPRGFSLRSLRSLWRLSPRTLVLHYHVLADRTYLFRMSHRHLDVEVLPIGRLQLTTDLRALIADEGERTALAEHTGITAALRRFPKIRRLVVVPHDAMADVPFAALPVDGVPLCQRVTLSQLDCLARLRRRRIFSRLGSRFGSRLGRNRPRRGAAIGLDDYGASGLPDLSRAEAEARAVAELLDPDTQPLLGAAATRTAALTALRQVERVHIAAHGDFVSQDPGSSGIVLREGDRHETLTLRELRQEPLSQLDLVTLATCRSAASALLPGGARICLPSAFLQAGARGVIASLWTVDDDVSAELMPVLHRELLVRPAAAALAAAQKHAIEKELPIHEWAGLVFYGND